MTYAALLYLTLAVLQFLPGSAYKHRPEFNWEGPHIYMALAATACGIYLAISVL